MINPKKILFLLLVIIFCLGIFVLSNDLLKKQTLFKSKANIFIKDKNLSITFQINDKDQANLNKFINNLGVDNKFTEGVSLELDQDSLNLISQSLPAEVNLAFEDKQLEFSSKNLPSLNSSLPIKSYQFATEDAKLELKYTTANDYSLEISEPQKLIQSATYSGKMHLSKQLEGLFPIMSKIARIKIRASGKSLQGNIFLN